MNAVTDVTMAIPANQVTALIGPSGSGKTTLRRALNCLHHGTRGADVSGSIRLGDIDLYGSGSDPVLVRTLIGMVFQRPNPFLMMIIYETSFPDCASPVFGVVPPERGRRVGIDRGSVVGRGASPCSQAGDKPLWRHSSARVSHAHSPSNLTCC